MEKQRKRRRKVAKERAVFRLNSKSPPPIIAQFLV